MPAQGKNRANAPSCEISFGQFYFEQRIELRQLKVFSVVEKSSTSRSKLTVVIRLLPDSSPTYSRGWNWLHGAPSG
jgi:hypothetical protein